MALSKLTLSDVCFIDFYEFSKTLLNSKLKSLSHETLSSMLVCMSNKLHRLTSTIQSSDSKRSALPSLVAMSFQNLCLLEGMSGISLLPIAVFFAVRIPLGPSALYMGTKFEVSSLSSFWDIQGVSKIKNRSCEPSHVLYWPSLHISI